MRDEWLSLARRYTSDEQSLAQTFQEIAGQYGQAGRFYHTLEHVAHVLRTVHSLRALYSGTDFDAILFASWLHDVIYDTHAHDNEERSADYARAMLARLHVPDALIGTVERLILATKAHQTGVDDVAGQILLDADLGILGVDETSYASYAAAIRAEYAWVAEDAYRAGRQQVLQRFLNRPRLYFTSPMFTAYEATARRNLAWEIARLSQPK